MNQNENYYRNKLSSDRLRHCYEVAPQRVKNYLQAEIDHVIQYTKPGYTVLELGCGYGRVLSQLAAHSGFTIGIDISTSSLRHAISQFAIDDNMALCCMNALRLGFPDNCFDLVICIQNGISAFGVDRLALIKEAVRVTKAGTGRILFSTYAPQFWEERLRWFRLQAETGLLGKIDDDLTGEGTIVCKDGFRATTVSATEFTELTRQTDCSTRLVTVDDSSLFCEMVRDESCLSAY